MRDRYEKDWYSVSMKGDPIEVYWSPEPGQNVRVKDENGNWHYASARRADQAYAVAARQLTEEDNEKR